MSLTAYITGRGHQEIRTRLKADFPKPTFQRPHPELKAPPRTKNYSLVGTAFDYLFRFHLEFHNKHAVVCREGWIADNAYESLVHEFRNYLRYRHRRQTSNQVVRESLGKFRLLRNQFIRAKKNYIHFIENGILSDPLLEDCLFLAKLDVVFRAGLVAHLFEEHDPADILDLKELISIVNFGNFVAVKRCYVNPVFGKASELVDGADCDLILDDALIEIKVTTDFQLRREHFNQLIGYYILSLIGGINANSRARPIKLIGIYFARHGILWLVNLNAFGNRKKYTELKDWFFEYVNRGRAERTRVALKLPPKRRAKPPDK